MLPNRRRSDEGRVTTREDIPEDRRPAFARRAVLAGLGLALIAVPQAARAAGKVSWIGANKTWNSGTMTLIVKHESTTISVTIKASIGSVPSFTALHDRTSTWSVQITGGTNRHNIKLGASKVTTKADINNEPVILNIPVKLTVPAHYQYQTMSYDICQSNFDKLGVGGFRCNFEDYDKNNGGANSAARIGHSTATREATVNLQVNLKAFGVCTYKKYRHTGSSITLKLARGKEYLCMRATPGTIPGFVQGQWAEEGYMYVSIAPCGTYVGKSYLGAPGMAIPRPTREGYLFDGWHETKREDGSDGRLFGSEICHEGAGGHEDRIEFSAHVAGSWREWVPDKSTTNLARDGAVSGFRARLVGPTAGSVRYRAYVTGGWTGWFADGAALGPGLKSPLYALEMQLTGAMAERYTLFYHVHSSGRWQVWTPAPAASDPKDNQYVTSVQCALVKKGTGYPFDYCFLHETSWLRDRAVYYDAKWVIRRFTVRFLPGHGENKPIKTQTVGWGGSATAPADPKRDGYAFKGWDRGFSNVRTDIDVTATWTPLSEVRYFADGELMHTQKGVMPGSALTIPAEALDACTREDCTPGWRGWFTDPACTKKWGGGKVPTGTLNLYSYNELTLSFWTTDDSAPTSGEFRTYPDADAPGATLIPAPRTVRYKANASLSLPQACYRNDGDGRWRTYRAEGYFGTPQGSSPQSGITPTNDTALYLRWRQSAMDGILSTRGA